MSPKLDPRRLVSGFAKLPELSQSITYSIWGIVRLVDARPPTAEGPGAATFMVRKGSDAVALARAVTGSRTTATRVLAHRQLKRFDGAAIPSTGRVEAGERVILDLQPGTTEETPSHDPLSVLYEDCFLIAVEKPAGILVHGDGTGSPTLAGRVLGHLQEEGSAAVPQAIHRLDVDTTGIVLFSLASETQPAFDALVLKNQITKRYYALIHRKLPAAADGSWLVVDAPIARDRHDARRMRVGSTGRKATTRLRVVGERDGHMLVEAELVTGRRHQIRVHLAHLGCPIVGDELYGAAHDEGGLHLHAHELQLRHPLTGRHLILESPCPW